MAGCRHEHAFYAEWEALAGFRWGGGAGLTRRRPAPGGAVAARWRQVQLSACWRGTAEPRARPGLSLGRRQGVAPRPGRLGTLGSDRWRPGGCRPGSARSDLRRMRRSDSHKTSLLSKRSFAETPSYRTLLWRADVLGHHAEIVQDSYRVPHRNSLNLRFGGSPRRSTTHNCRSFL